MAIIQYLDKVGLISIERDVNKNMKKIKLTPLGKLYVDNYNLKFNKKTWKIK